jgi:murein DD-endopeptidase MepM/ murein hydrolase activator NlpD
MKKRSYFWKKRLSDAAQVPVLSIIKAVLRCYKFVFTKRTVLFVTNQKIRTITLGPLTQACLMLCVAWIGNLFIQSLYYNEIISAKSKEISNLESVNEYFKDEFDDINGKLAKINEYLASVSGGIHKVNSIEVDQKKPKNIKDKNLSDQDEETLNEIKDANNKLASVQSVVEDRIKTIERAMAITGLNVKKPAAKSLNKKYKTSAIKEFSLNGVKGIADRQGGPLSENQTLDESLSKASVGEDDLERHLSQVKFTGEIDYLMVLEKLVGVMPFAKPMKNYYISSGFGSRSDPLTGRMAEHYGLDFVGTTNEKIISPSVGRVILAGKFSDYGNAVVIDHGFGITTRYGHLSEVKVKEGQMVKQGDVVALQGSTGRSTGPHLHYEVRYKNVPLNPRKFLEAGEMLFNDGKNPSYARI